MNKKLKIIIVIAILICSLIIFLIFGYYLKNRKSDKDLGKKKLYDEMMNEMIMPNGIFILKTTYKGTNDLEDFYRTIKNLGDYTITISNYSDRKISKKYDEIIESLEKEYKVKNSGDIIEVYKGKNLKEIINATIDSESMKKFSKKIEFDMSLDYNNDISINYHIVLKNTGYKNNFVEYTLIK